MNSGAGNKLTEKELVRLVGRGEERGRRELYLRYAGNLTAVASRYIADPDAVKDVLQEAFIRIFERFDSFSYRGEGSLRAWMSRVVANCALQALRKDNSLLVDRDIPDAIPDDDPEVDDVPMDVLQEMIRHLPDGYRTVFNLYVFEQMPHKEIAGLLGIKENSSASQLLRAKALLAREIKEYRRRNANV